MKNKLYFTFGTLGFVLCLALTSSAWADVKMPSVFGSKMVLQRELAVPVWGWAEPGEEITVSIAEQTKKAKTDGKGNWSLRLDPMKAGGPYTMTIIGKNKLEFSDVLFGDVWICSGQSNMGFTLKSAQNAKEEIANANFPQIRLLTVHCTSKAVEQNNVAVKPWDECSSATAPSFSAVGYFFGRKLYQELNVPIGLINNSWGGATCEAYVEAKRLAEVPEFAPVLDAKRIEKLKPQYKAAHLYNGMVLPIKPYGIKGVIWYQGEANAGRAAVYEQLFPVMIQNWREIWGQGDFPFYFVQLANFMKVATEPEESAWAELREAQTRTLSLRNTGQAVTIDIGEANDIHPKNKQDVGLRLAAWALAKDYGKDVPYSSPMFQSMKIEGNQAILSFQFGDGLFARGEGDNVVPTGFTIAGEDRRFYNADAKIVEGKVVVSSPKVPVPVAVRYAWANNPVCNLYNKAGFPLCPFRTDLWPRITHKNR